jgi:hypothetical protein
MFLSDTWLLFSTCSATILLPLGSSIHSLELRVIRTMGLYPERGQGVSGKGVLVGAFQTLLSAVLRLGLRRTAKARAFQPPRAMRANNSLSARSMCNAKQMQALRGTYEITRLPTILRLHPSTCGLCIAFYRGWWAWRIRRNDVLTLVRYSKFQSSHPIRDKR